MEFCTPNLPDKLVKSVFVSEIISREILKNLENLGIKSIFAPKSHTLTTELAYHPDIVLNNPIKGLWYSASDTNMNNLLTKGDALLNNKYPGDCKYNCFIIGGILYGGKDIAEEILDLCEKRIVVNQGYTKCSTVILDKQNFITSDVTIYNALRNQGKTVLKVTNGGIRLNGFSCGFIGGCTGVLGGKILAITGNAEMLADYAIIKDFCDKLNYKIISLTKEEPYDYGGILPIYE